MSSYEISDKVVLVTGGASGIGAAVVENFLNEGAKHVAILDINNAAGKKFEKTLNTKFGMNKALFVECDVIKEDQINKACDEVFIKYGYIDVFVNNAGIMNEGREHYKKEIGVNFTGVVACTIKAYDLMRKDGGGRGGTVINVSSTAGISKRHILPVYWATKSAVLQFSVCMASEPNYTRTGVRLLTICFGKTESNLVVGVTTLDKSLQEEFPTFVDQFPSQSSKSAANGTIEMYKNGRNGSVWLVVAGNISEITGTVDKVYEMYAGDIEATENQK